MENKSNIIESFNPQMYFDMISLGLDMFKKEDREKYLSIINHKPSFFERLKSSFKFLITGEVDSVLNVEVLRKVNQSLSEFNKDMSATGLGDVEYPTKALSTQPVSKEVKEKFEKLGYKPLTSEDLKLDINLEERAKEEFVFPSKPEMPKLETVFNEETRVIKTEVKKSKPHKSRKGNKSKGERVVSENKKA